MNPSSNFSQKHDILPHRKILILGAVCISIIGIILTYKITKERRLVAEKGYELSVVGGKTEEQRLADQKIIEALNKAKIDSLGALASSTNPFDPSPKDTVSDRFTKDIFSAYLRYEQDGILPDGDSLVNNLEYLDVSDIQKNKYTLAYLNIFAPTSKDQIRAYGNEYARVFLKIVDPVAKDTFKYQSDINNMVPIYKSLGENLLKISVPSAVANEHLGLVNQYLKQADAFVLVGGEVKDPVKALLGLQVIREGIPAQVEMYTKIKKYLYENDIVYEKSEPGNFWNVGTTTVSLTQ
ncbi:MAG: hypothetical protein QG568_748 [Patescibacteria group bacterium]|nr:hypothetical protein [Patescibacteria group bacterium]